MKRLFFSFALTVSLAACASPGYDHEGLRTTQEMMDMDGRPIAPSGGAVSGFGFGIGIGTWGHRGGAGVGFGTGW